MFDKQPKQSAPAHEDIDFLHSGDYEAPRQKAKNEPVGLVRFPVPLKDSKSGIVGTWLRKFAGLLKRSASPTGGKPSTVSKDADTTRKEEPVSAGVPTGAGVKLSSPGRAHGGALGVVDPFEQEPAKQEALLSTPTARPVGHSDAYPEHERKSIERIKNVPLSELRSSSALDRFPKGSKAKESKEKEKKRPQTRPETDSKKTDTSGVFDVNLLPARQKHLSVRAKKILSLSLVSVEFLGLLLVFLLWQAKADGRMLGLRELESKKTLLEIQIKGYKPVVADATTLQKRVSILQSLFAERKDPNLAFGWLEANTLQTVFYDSFSLSNEGKFQIGLVAGDVVSAAQQLKLFLSDPEWKQVDVSGLALKDDEKGGTVVSYNLQLTPREEFYHPVRE